MQKTLLDTNLIIRFLLNDDPKKADKIGSLLIRKKHNFLIPDMVVAEIIWVLSSYYEFEKSSIIDKIKALVHLESISCSRSLLDHSLNIWERYNISFVDAYLVAVAELGGMTLYTYDKRLGKIPTIIAREP